MNAMENALIQRIKHDLADSYDEEFELELEDRNLDALAESGMDISSESYKEERRRCCTGAHLRCTDKER